MTARPRKNSESERACNDSEVKIRVPRNKLSIGRIFLLFCCSTFGILLGIILPKSIMILLAAAGNKLQVPPASSPSDLLPLPSSMERTAIDKIQAAPSFGHADEGDITVENVTEAVRSFLSQTDAFKPDPGQTVEMKRNSILFLTGRASCAAICARGAPGSFCARDWFDHLNHTDAIRAAFPSTACADLFGPGAGPWLPAA
eukprot:CAMPEP_0172167822 /NCGR_PEP_ID=MMETSP1050-20130122/9788_1 /TAXON_ID=233186 /ORGANISM="Cryptomonas curvata, Strain CCAP979/52" /LENGTH=200 /DNA_ID=CAMNT_0012838661 /DNA_START=25 /DNA_END=624 /DNA_ORIENTATION=+